MDWSPPAFSVCGTFLVWIWSRLPFPPPGDLPNPGNRTCISWVSCIAGGFFSSEPPGKSRSLYRIFISSMLLWCFGCGFFVFLFSWWLAVSALTNEKVKVTPSWPTLCKPMDCSLPGSSPSDSPGDNTGVKKKKNTGVSSLSLLRCVGRQIHYHSATWEVPKIPIPYINLNPDLPHCRWILYHLSYQGKTLLIAIWFFQVFIVLCGMD